MKRLIGLSLVWLSMVILLPGCNTPYAPSGITGGYSIMPIDRHRYDITINSSGFTSLVRAKNILMLRAAELALDNGFERFVIEKNGLSVASANATSSNLIARAITPMMPGLLQSPRGGIRVKLLKPTDPHFENGLEAKRFFTLLAPHLKNKPMF